MGQPLVSLERVSKQFIDGELKNTVLDRVNLQLNPGDTLALTGASGCGKSTLLNVIAGFEQPSSGELTLLGQSSHHWQDKHWCHFRRQHLGVVFQQFNLLTPLDVAGNIAFSLHLNGHHWNTWCDHLVAALGLGALLTRHVDTLSGGQQQRVAIARALAHKPELILADEPTGNLDNSASLEVMALFCELAAINNTCILLVTHSQACAEYMQRSMHLSQGKLDDIQT